MSFCGEQKRKAFLRATHNMTHCSGGMDCGGERHTSYIGVRSTSRERERDHNRRSPCCPKAPCRQHKCTYASKVRSNDHRTSQSYGSPARPPEDASHRLLPCLSSAVCIRNRHMTAPAIRTQCFGKHESRVKFRSPCFCFHPFLPFVLGDYRIFNSRICPFINQASEQCLISRLPRPDKPMAATRVVSPLSEPSLLAVTRSTRASRPSQFTTESSPTQHHWV